MINFKNGILLEILSITKNLSHGINYHIPSMSVVFISIHIFKFNR